MKRKSFMNVRKLAAVLLSAVLFLYSPDIGAAAGSYFTGSITSDDAGISLEGISIDVYGSRLRYSDNGLKRYEHYYCRTVKTDRNGSFSFLRPSSRTLLKVELDTLPPGTGVNEPTRLVTSRYDETFSLSYIDDINIAKSANGKVYKVNFTASDGTLLFTDHEVTDTVTSDSGTITYNTLNSVRLDRTVTVSASGLSKSRTFMLDISDCTVSGKLAYLLDNGIISDEDKQRIIDEYAVDTAPPEDPRPVFFRERTYTAGNFMLHSEQGTANIEEYERALSEIVDVYFGKYGFLEPYHEFFSGSTTVRERYFHIYLVDPDAIKIFSDVEPKNVVGKARQIDPDDVTKGGYVVLAPSDPLKFKGSLSHEIFHCIIYRYTGKNQAAWFKEAFANYGSVLCLDGTSSNLRKHISYYLNSTAYPLNSSSSYKNRQYGIYLLPLYIHNEYGGVETIKSIFRAYADTTNAYKAIDKGLRAVNSSYSFSGLFAGFKDMNAFSAAYGLRDLSSDDPLAVIDRKAARNMVTTFGDTDTAATPDTTLSGNSAAYFEFRAPEDSSGTLTVTVETAAGVSDASYNLILNGKDIIVPKRGKAAELMTFVLTDLGGSVSSAVLAAGNTSMSSKSQINFTATAFFAEK